MTNLIDLNSKNPDALTVYGKVLELLRKKEQSMGPSPYLKDWFEIRNQIRRIERKIKELRYEKY